MDMLTIDLTEHPEVQEGDTVELWGTNIPGERIAKSAGTIGYELLCQISERVRIILRFSLWIIIKRDGRIKSIPVLYNP